MTGPGADSLVMGNVTAAAAAHPVAPASWLPKPEHVAYLERLGMLVLIVLAIAYVIRRGGRLG